MPSTNIERGPLFGLKFLDTRWNLAHAHVSEGIDELNAS